MKELSIEEKAKRYDVALERARKFATDLPNGRNDRLYHVGDLESIFPELKESEDERIRKMLIEQMEHWHECALENNVVQDIKDSADAITWLEKQGQVKESVISQHENKTCEENDDSLTSEDEKIRKELLSFFIERAKYTEDSTFNGLSSKEIIAWLEKQGEQKPILDVEIPFGAKDSELQEAIYNIPNGYHAEIEDDKVVIKKGEQKPAEVRTTGYWNVQDIEQKPTWSEEDEAWLNDIINDTEQGAKLDSQQIDWLRYLKDRVQPQPKQEWSEEDEVKAALTIRYLEIAKNYQTYIDSNYIDGCIDWLKSLKERYTWKPSDEQMKALQEAIIEMGKSVSPCSIEEFHEIQSLYCDLKKLKEE